VSTWAARAKLHLAQKVHRGTDETDKTPISSVLTVHTGPFLEKRESANDAASTTPQGSPDGLRVVSPALDAVLLMAAGLAADPDRWSYPRSTAMNTAEIDRFTARLARFTDRGVILSDAERLADLLVIRDREQDDRALCLECTHLQRAGRCGNWQRAGVAIRARDAFMPLELVRQLQRCDGFSGSAVNGNQGVTHE